MSILPPLSASNNGSPDGNSLQTTLYPTGAKAFSIKPELFVSSNAPDFWYPTRTTLLESAPLTGPTMQSMDIPAKEPSTPLVKAKTHRAANIPKRKPTVSV